VKLVINSIFKTLKTHLKVTCPVKLLKHHV